MTRTDDEAFISFLREQTRGALPEPGLDPGSVLAASRRKRTAIRVARTAGALVVAGLVVVGVTDLVTVQDRSAPPVDHVPDPSEPALVIGLAEGITAVQQPVETTVPAGAAALDLGSIDFRYPGDRALLTAGSADGDAAPDADAGRGVGLWAGSAEGPLSRVTTLSWLPGDSPQDYPDGVYPAPTRVVEPVGGRTLLIGAVPSWITDPAVTLHLASDVTLSDGTTSRSVQVPTFAAPTEDGRLLYLVVLDATAGVSDGEGYAVTIADGAGETLTAGCSGSDVEACIASVADPVSDLPEMCAELPSYRTDGPSYEGWWSSTPANSDGTIRTDPADWPPIMREHPQTAQIDTRTRTVIESVDRYACGPLVGYEIPADLELPPDAVVIVDAVTGEILATMSPPFFEPGE